MPISNPELNQYVWRIYYRGFSKWYDGNIRAYAIMATTANKLVETIHNRMPESVLISESALYVQTKFQRARFDK